MRWLSPERRFRKFIICLLPSFKSNRKNAKISITKEDENLRSDGPRVNKGPEGEKARQALKKYIEANYKFKVRNPNLL